MPYPPWSSHDAPSSPLRTFQPHARIPSRFIRGAAWRAKPNLDTARLTAAEKDALFETELFSLNDFFRRIYGIPTKLSEMGISRKELAAVAKQARYDGAALYNKQEITEEVAFTILEAAY